MHRDDRRQRPQEPVLNGEEASWAARTGGRGGWTLTAKGPSLTLVELAVEVQMNHVPTFVLRNINLRRVAETVRGVDQRLRTGSSEKW